MARSGPARQATKSLVWLAAITVGLFALLGAGVAWGGASWTPKLALDLQGGTELILAPQLSDGQQITQEQLDQAVAVIRSRVDSQGVSEAEVTSQGGSNIVVGLPGTPSDETIALVQAASKLDFRPVICTNASTVCDLPETVLAEVEAALPAEDSEDAGTLPEEPLAPLSDERAAEPENDSDTAWITSQLYWDFLQASQSACASIDDLELSQAATDEPLVTCDPETGETFILGPVEVSGERISDATAGQQVGSNGIATNEWAVYITFDAQGTEEFAEVTTRLVGYDSDSPQNRFAMVLDGSVISAPKTNAAITNGRPEISGSFTQESAKLLASQLKNGSLPVSFALQSQDVRTATLGQEALNGGLIAGLIGLVLVLIYSLFQYRLLGFVTIASLIIAAILTYVLIAIFSWRIGYSLSLAGIAGLIVAIGFTADSFIVYFERIRDELRDGRTLPASVEAGWKRALRTILSAKFINLLSAVVLYFIAVGSVKGFAFTLGLTTIIDVLVVLLFTHPMLQLLAQTRFFAGGHPLTGLDPEALGAVYRGRAEFRFSADRRRAGASREAAKRQTIAERRAAEAKQSRGAAAGTLTKEDED